MNREFVHELQINANKIRVFASQKQFEAMQNDGSLKQAEQVATLPGIVDAALVMPDAHRGYGFPVGGVAAADAKTGFISPGGIGFDINCGVRLLVAETTYENIKPYLKSIVQSLNKKVPSGVGKESVIKLTEQELDEVLQTGVQFALKRNMGNSDDAKFCENNGCIEGADPTKVSQTAKSRGKNQLATLGSGNHFLEIQKVEHIFEEHTAKEYGLHKEQIVIMIHCGSRGLGHQICSDYVKMFQEHFPHIAQSLQERDLMYAPIHTQQAQEYIAAMKCAMNFAWCNRHIIGNNIREVFAQHNIAVRTLYDLGHNNAKLETHKGTQVYVHRKGAARAFAANHPDISVYQHVGHPVLVPGSMGTASYVLRGTNKGMDISFGTCCHGAGRVMSRKKAQEQFDGKTVIQELEEKNIVVHAKSLRGITEEAPGVYKDIDEVVETCAKADIAQPVARLVPVGVIKG